MEVVAAINHLKNMVVAQLEKSGLKTTGVAISASAAALYCYCATEEQRKALAATLPDLIADFSVLVKYRGPSRRITLIELT